MISETNRVILETDRLIIREFQDNPNDYQNLHQLLSSPELMKYFMCDIYSSPMLAGEIGRVAIDDEACGELSW